MHANGYPGARAGFKKKKKDEGLLGQRRKAASGVPGDAGKSSV
jgi:hypothetical protein